jgi:hypothetical protein
MRIHGCALEGVGGIFIEADAVVAVAVFNRGKSRECSAQGLLTVL